MKKYMIVATAVALFPGAVFAVCEICPDCYRCTSYSGCNCTNCVYDETHCEMPGVLACFSDDDCDKGFVCINYECVTGAIEEIACDDGEYQDGDVCTPCPRAGDWLMASCSPHSRDGGMDGVTSCYFPSGCEFSDSTGRFVITEDCGYSE